MWRQFGKPHRSQMTCLKSLDTSDQFANSVFLVCLMKMQYTHVLPMHLKHSVINTYLPWVGGMQSFNNVQMLLL